MRKFILLSGLLTTLNLASCSSPQSTAPPPNPVPGQRAIPTSPVLDPTTPEGTLELYLQSLIAGDEEGVKALLYPVGREFHLEMSVPVSAYAIANKNVLDLDEARQHDFVPAPEAGDVRLDVQQIYEAGNREMFTYWLRQVDGTWKIYAWSSWEKENRPPIQRG